MIIGDSKVDWQKFDAVLFDLDGVITATASVHAAAWKQMFDEYLAARAEKTGDPLRLLRDRGRLQALRGRPAPLRRRRHLPQVAGDRPAPGRAVGRPGSGDGLRPGQPQEHPHPGGPGHRRGGGLRGLGEARVLAPPAGDPPGHRLVEQERRGGPGGGGHRRTSSRSGSTGSSPPGRSCPASRGRTRSWRPPGSSGWSRSGRWWSRTPWPG